MCKGPVGLGAKRTLTFLSDIAVILFFCKITLFFRLYAIFFVFSHTEQINEYTQEYEKNK
ncbi:hypothetical protein GCM10019997_06980 [Prevotella corporis]